MIAAQSERLTFALRGLTLAAIAIAVGALVWQPSLEADLPDEATGTLAGDSTGAYASVAPARAGDAQRIIASNIFAASRRAPVRRYAAGREAPDDAGANAEPGTAYDPALAGEAPSLLGTVLGALGDRALLLAPQVDSSARFYRVGERVGSYRIRRIEAGRVVLDGPTGRLVLELLKPNEARQ